MHRLMVPICCLLAVAFICAPHWAQRTFAEDDQTSDDARTVAASLAKLTQEIMSLKTEVRELRESLAAASSGTLSGARGQAKFDDGKKREFEGLAGVREQSGVATVHLKQRVPRTLIIEGDDDVEHQILIEDLAGFDIGQKDDKHRVEVVLRGKNGRKQTTKAYYWNFEVDVKWRDAISVDRLTADKLQGFSFNFIK